jgi:uncharacterized membrane protein YeaQ/YmgE (transglycosylase-associated protein family)
MMGGAEFIILVLFWFICGVIASAIADQRGASAGLGFLAGLLLGPLGIILSFFLESSPTEQAVAVASGQMLRCPHCAELVQPEALLCKHCRSRLANRCAWCQRRIGLPSMPCAALPAIEIAEQWPIGDVRCQQEAASRGLP